MWAVSTVTMLVLAGALPDFQLESSNGDSATRIAVTAGVGAAVFGLLSSLVWPLLVRALLLVPALVLGLLVFFLNGSLLLIALRINPSGQGEAAPETAVVVAAVMSAVASATGVLSRSGTTTPTGAGSTGSPTGAADAVTGRWGPRPPVPSSSNSTAWATTCWRRRSARG